MKKLIAELKRKKEAAEKTIKEAESTILATSAALKAIQDICTHHQENDEDALEYVGRDSHHHHYECTICGKWISV